MGKASAATKAIIEIAAGELDLGLLDEEAFNRVTDLPRRQDAARELHRTGHISVPAYRKITARGMARPAPLPALPPKEIVRVREATGLSQAVFAARLNVSKMLVSKWERGERKPSGAALKLLTIVRDKGIEVTE